MALRGLESLLAWHEPTQRWAFRHLSGPESHGRYRTLAALRWDSRTDDERSADDWWNRVPSVVEEILATHGWVSAAGVGARAAARFWLLLRECDRANDRRCELLERHRRACRRSPDAYPFAIVVDRSAAIAEHVQVYGTLLDSDHHATAPIVEPGMLDVRREVLGLRAHDRDVARGVDELAVVRWLSRRAEALSIRAPRADHAVVTDS